MNTLENLLFEGTSVVETVPSNYQYGAYFMLRHNTMDHKQIVSEYQTIYNLCSSLLCGQKYPQSDLRVTPRVPASKYVDICVDKQHPMMVSTVELKKGKGKECLVSHHYLYGTHWHLNFECDDEKFSTELEATLKNYLNSVNADERSFLLQPVGQKPGQEVDRMNDETIKDYIRFIDQPDSDLEDETEEQDTLLMYFCKLMKPRVNYSIHYSFCL